MNQHSAFARDPIVRVGQLSKKDLGNCYRAGSFYIGFTVVNYAKDLLPNASLIEQQ